MGATTPMWSSEVLNPGTQVLFPAQNTRWWDWRCPQSIPSPCPTVNSARKLPPTCPEVPDGVVIFHGLTPHSPHTWVSASATTSCMERPPVAVNSATVLSKNKTGDIYLIFDIELFCTWISLKPGLNRVLKHFFFFCHSCPINHSAEHDNWNEACRPSDISNCSFFFFKLDIYSFIRLWPWGSVVSFPKEMNFGCLFVMTLSHDKQSNLN